MSSDLEATRDVLGGPEQDRDYIVSVADNLGWKWMELDGVGKPDLLLFREKTIPVFIRSKRQTSARLKAASSFALAGSIPRVWGRQDGNEILRVLG